MNLVELSSVLPQKRSWNKKIKSSDSVHLLKKKQNGLSSRSACQSVMYTLLTQVQEELDHQKKLRYLWFTSTLKQNLENDGKR